MDIPYNSTARPDTGLYNAKVGVWLFLASEVMLFGALFSSYVLLRVGAAPGEWPHGLLNIPLGTFNTILLICSSITEVMAWASLKLNNFSRFKLYQAITLLLAVTFLSIKAYEYSDKFKHYEVQLNDGRVVDGHLVKLEGRIVDGHLVKSTAKAADGQPAANEEPTVEIHGRYVNKEDLKGVTHAWQARQLDEKNPEQPIELKGSEIKYIANYGPRHNTFTAIYFTMTGLHALHIIGGILVMGYLWGPGSKMWKTDPERFTNRNEIAGLYWHFVDLVWIFLFPVLYLT